MKSGNYICQNYKIGCVLIPKVASQSIKDFFDNKFHMVTHREFLNKKDYFKFTFVRNPYDRLLSYFYNKVIFRRYGGNEKWFLIKSKLLSCKTLEDFIIKLNEINILNKNFWLNSQSFLLYFQGILVVDYVGKFENMENDFKLIKQKSGIDKKLKIINSSNHPNFDDIVSLQTKKIAYNMFREDFINFSYSPGLDLNKGN